MILTLLSVVACNQQHLTVLDATIINDSFLEVVDTEAYHYNTLLPPPPVSTNELQEQDVNLKRIIIVDTILSSPEKYYPSALGFISDHVEYGYYASLFKEQKPFIPFDVRNLTNTGLYTLITPQKGAVRENVLGMVSFSWCLYNEEKNRAAYFTTISTGSKAGVVMLILLRKVNQQWQVVDKDSFERW
ncbi:MAG: hypothetical protein JWP88_849 [Flaviaesturariibacter sp.]|nr:hypothetical protein [Flaviaesturariibacter sp.]